MNKPEEQLHSLCKRGERILRDSGLKLTPQRSAILELFAGRIGHWTAQDIFAELEDCSPSMSRATVYNTLETFEEVGLLRRFAMPDGQTTFDRNTEHHHHAICTECDELYDVAIPPEALSELFAANGTLEFEVTAASVWYRGTCRFCR